MIEAIFIKIKDLNGQYELVSSGVLGIFCHEHSFNYEVLLGVYNIWVFKPYVDVQYLYDYHMAWHKKDLI